MPSSDFPPTNAAASLYVGDLHHDVTEDMLFEKFSPVGVVCSIRVCRDRITGRSLGYAYVNFQVQADAERALDTMNFDVIHGRPVRIMWTQHDPTLRDSGVGNIFIKNLEKSIDSEDLYHTFSVFGNILSCKVACDENGSKGYGFVHFETQEAAERAIKRLNGMLFNDQKVFIGCFKTRREREAELGAQVPYAIKGSRDEYVDEEKPMEVSSKHDNTSEHGQQTSKTASSDVTNPAASLYVGDLHYNVTEDMLHEKFGPVGAVRSIRVCRDRITGRSLGYAYVNFQQQADAERALETMNFDVIHGRPVRIMWTQHDPTLRDSGVGNIFIKNLEKSIDSEDLYHTFSVFGNILSCKVACDENGSKGYGFVHFETREAAEQAIKRLNGMLFNDQKVFIGHFKTRRERSAELGAQVPNVIKGSGEDLDDEEPRDITGKHDSTNTTDNGEPALKMASSDVINPMASLCIGDLHHDVTGNMLYEKFSPVGAISSIQVCRDRITGRSLGYAYVNFQQQADAERAMDTMNFDVIKGRPVRIMWTQHDPSLRESSVGNIIIKNLEKSIKSEALYNIFSVFGNILSCKVACDENGSKGYGFVHFETQEAAERAIERLNGMLFNNQKVFIGRFKTRKERNPESGPQFTNVFIKGLGEEMDDEKLREVFSKYGNTISTRVITDNSGKFRGFGFVRFERHEDAQKAVDELNGKLLNGKQICVGRAMKKTKQQTQVKPKFVPHYRYQPAPPSGSFMAMPPQAHHPATGQWAQLRPGLRGGAPQGVRPQAQTRSPWPATVDAAAAARVQGVPQDQYPAGVKNSQQHMSAGKVEKLP